MNKIERKTKQHRKFNILISVIAVLLSIQACKNNTDNKKNDISQNDTIKEITPHIKDSFEIACDKFINDTSMFNAAIGIYFYDTNNKKVLFQHNSNLALIPASTLKLFTTAAALEILGANKYFYTYLQYDGKIIDNVLQGNIYIKGGGDPTLGSKFFNVNTSDFLDKWSNEIKKLNIDSITGHIIADASFFEEEYVPPTWSYGEIGEYYCTAACGINVYDNQYDLTFYTGKKGRYKATKIVPYIPDFYYDNKTLLATKEKALAYIIAMPYQNEVILKGTVMSNSANYTITGAIPDPPLLVAYQLYEKLKSNNITIKGEYTTLKNLEKYNDSIYNQIVGKKRTNIFTQSSVNMAAIVNNTNQRSNNLFAETLLSQLGIHFFSHGSPESGTIAVIKFLNSIGIDTRGLNMFDGSGVSRYNTTTAKQLVDIIKYMQDSSKNSQVFYNSLPVSGESGTMFYFAKESVAKGKIRAKTGSMSNARSYAGHIKCLSGKELIFSVIVNNHNCDNPELKVKIEELLISTVKFQ